MVPVRVAPTAVWQTESTSALCHLLEQLVEPTNHSKSVVNFYEWKSFVYIFFKTFLGFLTGYRDPYGIVRGAANAPSAIATRWQFGEVNSFQQTDLYISLVSIYVDESFFFLLLCPPYPG